MIHVEQLRMNVIRPVLNAMGMYSQAAENLLIGTALHESKCKYLLQIDGPALGLYQMEPATHADLWRSYLLYRPTLAGKLWLWATRRETTGAPHPDNNDLIGNLFYATAAARAQYYRARPPLPDADDIQGLAEYWKDHWCKGCAGTVSQWVNSYID